VIAGVPPWSPAFDRCFNWADAVIDSASESQPLASLIDSLDTQVERLARVRRDNVVNSLRRHDWVHRWGQILDRLNLPHTPRMVERARRLSDLADSIALTQAG